MKKSSVTKLKNQVLRNYKIKCYEIKEIKCYEIKKSSATKLKNQVIRN